MASLTFKNLEKPVLEQKQYTYIDIALDMEESLVSSQSNYINTTSSTGRDVKVAYDLSAIQNSLRNLFNTIPGERILLPDYGSDIRRIVFEPVSETTARTIGRMIRDSIKKWEPRVQLINLNIVGDPDNYEYTIDIVIAIPFYDGTLSLGSLLTRDGFAFI